MENSLKNIFAVSDLRNRVLFTLGMLGVYRVGHHIPTPGVNTAALAELAQQMQNQMFGMYDMFSGGNLSRVTIFALGILMSMSLFGIVLAHTLADRRMTGHVARVSAAATALGSLALGTYWITGL